MFRRNVSHQQPSLFGFAGQLPPAKRQRLQSSWEHEFYQRVFCQIREEDFAVLYAETSSRPNAPVNTLVASIILMYRHHWTTEQLFDRIDFDLLTRLALGLDTLDVTPFCPATFFNFQNRLSGHYARTGVNLLEKVFDGLTAAQLQALQIRTDIQRSDSFQALSNIRGYSRTQLLVEVLIRLHRVLRDEDRTRFAALLEPYVGQSSSQFIYGLERAEIPHQLEQLGRLYHELYEALKGGYPDDESFAVFARVYREHFTVVENQAAVKPCAQLHGGILQSPDDLDATYRKKHGRDCRGQSINVTETAHPENALNLLTDVAVYANNTDDSTILGERLAAIQAKTPDLNELHTDGAYGSAANDRALEERQITHVQTAVRGRPAEVSMAIEQAEEGNYTVTCPRQSVPAQPARKRYKACFAAAVCAGCPGRDRCPAKPRDRKRTYYFDRSNYLLQRRRKALALLPPERRTLRANVEATIRQFSGAMNHKGKLPVRGRFRTMVYAYALAVSINFGRIWRYLAENPALASLFRRILGLFYRRWAALRRKQKGWLSPSASFPLIRLAERLFLLAA